MDVAFALIEDDAAGELVDDLSEFSRTGKISKAQLKWSFFRLLLKVLVGYLGFLSKNGAAPTALFPSARTA